MDWAYLTVIVLLAAGGLAVFGWRKKRSAHLKRLRTRVHEPLGVGAEDPAPRHRKVAPSLEGEADPDAGNLHGQLRRTGLLDAGILSGTTGAGFMWQWATIDPGVLEAADFSLSETIDSGRDFAQWVDTHYLRLSEGQQAGSFNRLLGYVGEQQAAERLNEAGHGVTMAETANNPDWDMIVDGLLVDVKTVGALSNAKYTHDHITYLVPEDATGSAAGNVEVLGGFSHAQATSDLGDALGQAATDGTLESLTGSLPFVTIALVGARELHAVQAGKTTAAAVEHGATETVIKSAAVLAGVQAGGTVGSFAGPLGSMAGAMLGAGVMVFASTPLVAHVKGRRLRSATRTLEVKLSAYGDHYRDRLDELELWACKPLQHHDETLAQLRGQAEAVQKSLRWRLWPTYGQVAAVEAVTVGEQRRHDVQVRSEETVALIRSAAQGRTAELGAVLLAVPDLLDRLGDLDPDRVEAIKQAKETIDVERRNLAPSRPDDDDPPDDPPEEGSASPTSSGWRERTRSWLRDRRNRPPAGAAEPD